MEERYLEALVVDAIGDMDYIEKTGKLRRRWKNKMVIPKEVIAQLKLNKVEKLTRTASIIFEPHQVRLHLPWDIALNMEIEKGDRMELTLTGKNNEFLQGKLIKARKQEAKKA